MSNPTNPFPVARRASPFDPDDTGQRLLGYSADDYRRALHWLYVAGQRQWRLSSDSTWFRHSVRPEGIEVHGRRRSGELHHIVPWSELCLSVADPLAAAEAMITKRLSEQE